MEQVSEFVVLKDVHYALLLHVHHTEEAMRLTVFGLADAEIKKGLDLVWELRELREDVLLFAHVKELCDVDRSHVEENWVCIITHCDVKLVTSCASISHINALR